MISCTRRIEFDAGHRLVNQTSKCKYLHGHRYAIYATFATDKGVDEIGCIIDFGEIKAKLGDWIDANWDHNTILWDQDKELGNSIEKSTGQKIYYMPYNPTAENMAEYLLKEICPKLFESYNARCIKIKLQETPNCFSDVDFE